MSEPLYPLAFPVTLGEMLYDMPQHMLDTPPGFHTIHGLRVLAYGAGVDGTGILAHWYESGRQLVDPIHIIVFADTGGERSKVYRHINAMNKWLVEHGFPPITTLTKGGRVETLEANCLRMSMLPSLAYGFKGCSHKFKIEPQDKFYNNLPAAKEVWAAGQLVTKMIGYEAREVKRWKRAKKIDDKYEYEFPLVEIGWNREDCLAAIERVGMPMPSKSSCFFCPAMTVPEIRQLREEEPILFHRALAIEAKFLTIPDRKCPSCGGKGHVHGARKSILIAEGGMAPALFAALVSMGEQVVFTEDGDLYHEVDSIFPCTCTRCNGSGRVEKTVKGLGRRFAWKDVDVIDQDMQEISESERCRSCIDYAPDEDSYEDILG